MSPFPKHALQARPLLPVLLAVVAVAPSVATEPPTPTEMITTAVRELLTMQEDDGAWPYEGVYRVAGRVFNFKITNQ